MPMATLKLRPGVNVEFTPSLNEAGISSSQLIRFRSGLPEKLGGWVKFFSAALSGIPKALHPWLDVNETAYLAVGTTQTLGAIADGNLTTITPQTYTSDFAPNFDTTNGQPTVTVDDANISNVTSYDSVEFKTPIAVGGLILSGVYPIVTVTGTTTYTITADSNATSTVSNGGAVPVFTTTDGSANITVTLTANGMTVADRINFPISTTLFTTGNDAFTKALLHCNGADTATTFTDDNAGGSAHTWTAAGNAQIDTASFEFGGASGLFDGTGDYVTTPDSSDFTLGSGDWTVDFWFNCNVAGGTQENLCGQCDSTPTNASTSFKLYRTTGNVIEAVACVSTTAFTVTGTTQFTNAANTGWHHCAFVRTGNSLKLFVDGVQEGSTTAISGTVNDSASVLAIGTTGAVTSNPWTGWMDEFRLSVGTARWTTTFTPPTAQYGSTAITVTGTYSAVSITDANNFVITVSSAADAASVVQMNEGLAELTYLIGLGPSIDSGSGYGTFTYGTGGYGTGPSGTSPQTGTAITPDDWTLDNWLYTLLAVPENGGVWRWTPGSGFSTAQYVADAPAHNGGAFVSMQTRMLICYASTEDLTIGIDQNPMLVKWSDINDYEDFTQAVDSQAGNRTLSPGSKIVSGMSVAGQELLWTDLGLWSMQYLGSLAAGVWGFTQVGVSCGLIGKHAAARLGDNVFWMGYSNFFMLQGNGVRALPSTVWDTVFQDLNTECQHTVVAWANTPFNEVWFFYPRASTGATTPDAFVKLNVAEGIWDPGGPLDRSAAIDKSILGQPIAATSMGIIYEHETSPDADGQPLNAWFETGLFALSDGQDVMFSDWFIPDFKYETAEGSASSASIQITIKSYYYPWETPTTHGPFTVSQASTYFNCRVRGRLISIKVESNDVGSWWRYGACRGRLAADGRMP